jgi:tetratricopeptide (TPR) repeat protein
LSSKCYREAEGGTLFPYSSCAQFIRQFTNEASVQLFYHVCSSNVEEIIKLVPELGQRFPKEDVSSRRKTSNESTSPTPDVTMREELRFLQSVTQFFFSLSKEAPLLLFIDDWQWCDSASLKLLQFMRSSNFSQHRILILCAFRDTELKEMRNDEQMKSSTTEFLAVLERERSLNVMNLKRFDRDNVAELLKKAFSRQEIRQEFLNLIYAKTGGNPFFVEEVLKALIEEGKIYRDEEGNWQRKEISEIVIPLSISNVVKHRLSRLGPEAVSVLSVASSLGEIFDSQILNQILPEIGPERLEAQLDNVAKTGLIFRRRERTTTGSEIPTHQFSFCDESVRDSLYENIPLEIRKSYHGQVALALEESFRNKGEERLNEHASELAFHFLRSGNNAKSLEYQIIAGREASKLYAHELACRNFRSALDLLPRIETKSAYNKLERETLLIRAELLNALGIEAQFVNSEFQNLGAYWEASSSIYQELGEKRKAANVLTKLGTMYHLMMFDLEKSGHSFEKALSLLQGDDGAESELARVYVWKLYQDVWAGDREKVLAQSREVLEMGQRVQAYDAIAMARSQVLGIAKLTEFEDSMSYNNHSIQLAFEHGYISEAAICYFHRACLHNIRKGASRQAVGLFLEALDYSSRTQNFMLTLFNKAELAYEAYLPLGEWKKAEELAKQVRESVQNLPPNSLFSIIADSVTGQVSLCKGNLDDAEEYLRRVETKTKGFGILQIDAPLYMSLARVYIYKGEYEKARAYLSRAYRRSKKRGLININCGPYIQDLFLMIEFALTYEDSPVTVEDSDFPNVDALFSEISKCCEETNEEWAFAYLQKAQGLIEFHRGDLQSSEESLEKSVKAWKKLEWVYELALTTSLLAEVYQSENKISEAIDSYKKSLGIFEELGAEFEIQKVKKSKEAFERLVESYRLTGTSMDVLSDVKSRAIFQYLVKTYILDSIVNKYPNEKCGWRSLRMIEKEARVPGSVLYAKTGGIGDVLKHLLQSKLIESAIFSGERGRGGVITKMRVAYMTNALAKEFVNRELRNKSQVVTYH